MRITFQGNEVELRRLGLSDIFEVQRIVGDIMAGADIRGAIFNEGDEFLTQIINLLVAGGDFAEQRLTSWLKSLFVEPLAEDAEIYLPGVIELLEALADHPDIEAFLESGGKALKRLNKKLALDQSPPETEIPA